MAVLEKLIQVGSKCLPADLNKHLVYSNNMILAQVKPDDHSKYSWGIVSSGIHLSCQSRAIPTNVYPTKHGPLASYSLPLSSSSNEFYYSAHRNSACLTFGEVASTHSFLDACVYSLPRTTLLKPWAPQSSPFLRPSNSLSYPSNTWNPQLGQLLNFHKPPSDDFVQDGDLRSSEIHL